MWAEQVGLGECGLMPDQFWSLTPRELLLKHAAFVRAERRSEWLVGRLAMLMTRYEKGKAPQTVTQLLGYRRMDRYPVKSWLLPKAPPR